MRDERVAAHMARNVVTVGEDTSLQEAIQLVSRSRIRHLPVVGEELLLLGIVTDRDLKRFMPSPLFGSTPEGYEHVLATTPLGRIMTREPFTVHPDAPLADAIRVMIDRKIGALPVVEEGCLVGIVTETDALRACLTLLAED